MSASEPDQPRAKRSRLESPSAQNTGVGALGDGLPDRQNGLSKLEKLQRAKELLANKDVLKAQLQALKERKALAASTQSSGQSSAKSAAKLGEGRTFKAAPLRLDEQGRDVDAPLKPLQKAQEAGIRQSQQPKGPRPEEFIDPNISDKTLKRLERRHRPGFDFVKAGAFQKEAQQQRLKAVYGDLTARQLKQQQDSDRKGAKQPEQMDANLIPLGERPAVGKEEARPDPIPDLEWWDAGLVSNPETYAQMEQASVNNRRITIYIEHPVPLEPPVEAPLPPPMPLPLTTRERKKLRTQRRLEKEKEKQELIRQGLLEPPKPKLKLSTFYRSLGVDAAADPTAIEQQVRADQEARMQAHEDRNLANKLTPAERREKKIQRLTGAANEGDATIVTLYRVEDLSAPQHRFKVRANAEELHMTGCALITDDAPALVVAEGGPKAQKKYAHIVLNRIKWNQDADDEDNSNKQALNKCTKIWSGTVKGPAFTKFIIESCRSEAAARKFLIDYKVEHYWHLVAGDKQED